jgi:hypothetical protein
LCGIFAIKEFCAFAREREEATSKQLLSLCLIKFAWGCRGARRRSPPNLAQTPINNLHLVLACPAALPKSPYRLSQICLGSARLEKGLFSLSLSALVAKQRPNNAFWTLVLITTVRVL